MAADSSLEGLLRSRLGITALTQRVQQLEQQVQNSPSESQSLQDLEWVVGEGDSIVEAYGAGHDSILVLPSYAGPGSTVTLSVPSDRSLRLHGLGAVINHGIRVEGSGSGSYGEAPVISGLTILETDGAGTPGVEILAAPYTQVRDVRAYGVPGDGFKITESSDGNSYGVLYAGCEAWNTGGIGFNTDRDAGPHGTRWENSHAIACKDFGVRARGTNWSFTGGTIQLCHDYGLEVRGGGAGSLSRTYIEGNDRGDTDGPPLEAYVKGHQGLTLWGNRWHGITPRSTEHDHDRLSRGLNAHDSQISLFGETFMRYTEGGLALFNCETEVMHTTQTCIQTGLLAPSSDDVVQSFGRDMTHDELASHGL